MPRSRIDSIFASHRPVLMPFITGGFPSLEATRRIVPQLETSGASIVEIGFPFSDPIADGPVIAQAMHRPAGGLTPKHLFELVGDLRSRTNLGLIAMVSDSIVACYGEAGAESFVARCCRGGLRWIDRARHRS